MPTSPDISHRPPVFSGEYRPSLDEKKRLTIPARWRVVPLNEIFILKSPRGCLLAMPLDVLEAMGEQGAAQAGSLAGNQSFKDYFFSAAITCPIDSQGRLVLSDDLCNFAGLKKEVALAGCGSKFDIWNPELWQARKQQVEPDFQALMRNMGL